MPGRRPLTPDAAYARELGIATRIVKRAGGAAKLQAVSPEVRELLLHPEPTGPLNVLHKGGLAARGMGQRAKKRI